MLWLDMTISMFKDEKHNFKILARSAFYLYASVTRKFVTLNSRNCSELSGVTPSWVHISLLQEVKEWSLIDVFQSNHEKKEN